MHEDMTGKVVLITGANSGIGKEAAVALARMGATVIVGARNEQRGRKALHEIKRRARVIDDRVSLLPLDLARFRSIRAAAATVLAEHDRLDVLVNNAGGILSDRRVTEDGFEMMFGVNHLGHFLLTQLLLERLEAAAPSRIINVSSIAHHLAGGMTFSDLQHERLFNGTMVYNETKLANVLFTMELARRLEGTGVVANCLHPGAVRSGFGAAGDTRGIEHLILLLGKPFMVSSHRGAQPIVRLAALPEFERATGGYYVGGYLSRCAKHPASTAGRDPAAARRLWEMSESLVAAVPVSEGQDAG
jgi:NAD(P)-dependent dehydrogenase (short-subunit alcohol dehydrogenase family)